MDSCDDTHDKTIPLSSVRPTSPQPTRVSLVAHHAHGVEVASLPSNGALTVGRAAPAELAIPDPSLSRQHARFFFEGEVVWVEDLGSTNGTRVNGESVQRIALKVDDEVRLGIVEVSLHERSSTVRGAESRDRFTARLEEELARSRFYGRELALILVRSNEPDEHPLRRWSPHLHKQLRSVDRVGLLNPDVLALLMPETGAEAAAELARAAVQGQQGQAHQLLCSVTSFPQTGNSAAKLMEVGHVALGRAEPDRPVQSAANLEDPERWFEQRQVDLGSGRVVVASAPMREVYETVERLAASTIPVLVFGETGTGKELVARAIHERGERSKGPLRCVNCAAIPDQLIESALFGHERGAFTGATQRAKGVFEEASGGTVLLDEVGELSASAQAALLRVLETKLINRVGSSKELPVDVRVVAATHRDLEEMCDAGTFRWDLLFRLNTMVLRVPPLRERVDEIEPLARFFLARATEQGVGSARELTSGALEALRGYHWPGNVRELRNEIERAVVIARGAAIEAADLSARARTGARAGQGAPERAPVECPVPPAAAGERMEFKELVRRYEARLIEDALRANGWNQAAAARELNIPVRTMTNKVRLYDLRQPR